MNSLLLTENQPLNALRFHVGQSLIIVSNQFSKISYSKVVLNVNGNQSCQFKAVVFKASYAYQYYQIPKDKCYHSTLTEHSNRVRCFIVKIGVDFMTVIHEMKINPLVHCTGSTKWSRGCYDQRWMKYNRFVM